MSRRRVAVLGAGPAGLGAALRLARTGVEVDVYERGDRVGGLAQSISLWEQKVELGAHLLLLEDPRIVCLWKELIGSSYDSAPRDTKIVTADGKFRYPYEPLQVIGQLGFKRAGECAIGMARRPSRDVDGKNLQDWIVRRFGYPAFEALIADFCVKRFGRPACEIDADLAGSLLGFKRQPSIGTIIRSTVSRKPEPPVVRPIAGVGDLMEKMHEDVLRRGGRVHLNVDVTSLQVDRGRVHEISFEGSHHKVDSVLSTVPWPILLKMLTEAPDHLQVQPSEFEARSVILLFALWDGPAPFPGQWLYLADPASPVGRVTNFSAWRPMSRKPRQTILSFELWCDPSEELWRLDDHELSRYAVNALNYMGIDPGPSPFVATKSIRRANAFPVLQLGYKEKLEPIGRWIAGIGGLRTAGRFGSFGNFGVHESILLGMDAADAIAGCG